MTIYVSRNATADQPRRPEPSCSSSQWQLRPADPPLLTHLWRQLFEQQTTKGDRR
ncbi:multiple cyclophane-containing RiPP AmcA [Micromonospora echinaurantiaca]|uniref:multiple cyclophane-containing RiPP AmcA n=1 Tax=Micromonospora echinaurantiaca TaxID=47857 RepID=UPI00343C8046